MAEILCGVGSKSEADSSSQIDVKPFSVTRVRPQQISDGAFQRNFDCAFEFSNLVDGVETRGKAAMHAEDALVDEGAEGHKIEGVSNPVPW